MGEHESIEESARLLLADINDDRLDSGELAAKLGDLAKTIEDHIDVENGVVAGVDAARLAGPWAAAWQDGLSDFDRLKADWMAFLGKWGREAIARDRHGFQHEAEAILGRLRERLQIETQSFYATALQTGAIELR